MKTLTIYLSCMPGLVYSQNWCGVFINISVKCHLDHLVMICHLKRFCFLLQTKQMDVLVDKLRIQFENIQKLKTLDKLKRVVKKDGTTSVLYKNISKKRRRYFSDFYTTLLDSSWSFCVLMFASCFYGSWLFFAILYYFLSYLHGDLDQENLSRSEWIPCINQIGKL